MLPPCSSVRFGLNALRIEPTQNPSDEIVYQQGDDVTHHAAFEAALDQAHHHDRRSPERADPAKKK